MCVWCGALAERNLATRERKQSAVRTRPSNRLPTSASRRGQCHLQLAGPDASGINLAACTECNLACVHRNSCVCASYVRQQHLLLFWRAAAQVCLLQIFVGGDFVGGASELQALIDDGGLQRKLSAANDNAFPPNIAALVEKHVAAASEAGPSKEEQKAAALAQQLASQLAWPEQLVQCAALTFVATRPRWQDLRAERQLARMIVTAHARASVQRKNCARLAALRAPFWCLPG